MADSTAIPGTTLRLVSYGISYEPLPDPKYELPAEIKEQTDALYPSIAEKPAEAIPILEGWVERYPNAAKLLNFLSAAYSSADMPQKARDLAERNLPRQSRLSVCQAQLMRSFSSASKISRRSRRSWAINGI